MSTTLYAAARPVAIGKYRIESVIGEGGMGTVYRGFDPSLNRSVAIKTLNNELLRHAQRDELIERFRQEAQAAARLSHPNIVTVHEYGEHNGVPYIAMELIEGQNLEEFLRDNRRPGLDWSLQLMRQLLDALDYCHARDIVHRDLKPANIFLLPEGLIKVGDFGVARVLGSDLTHYGGQGGCRIGTYGYMSPEQFVGQPADTRSDLFSAGVMLYELLAGRNPLSRRESPVIEYEPLGPSDPSLPSGIDQVLRKALAPTPDDRFQTAQELGAALNGLMPAPRQPTRGRLASLALVAIAVVSALLGSLFWERHHDRDGQPQPMPGSVELATQPPGAEVWLGTQRLGTTPLRYELPAGSHRIILKKTGYEDLSAALDVEAGADMDLDLPLIPSRR